MVDNFTFRWIFTMCYGGRWNGFPGCKYGNRCMDSYLFCECNSRFMPVMAICARMEGP
jgi:hypothetical protein